MTTASAKTIRTVPGLQHLARVRSWVHGSIAVGVISAMGVGCTWVSVTPEAEAIRVAPSKEYVKGCKDIGQIKARTKSSIGIFGRNAEKVAKELESLAKNDAVEMGANTIVAEGPPTESGEQKFHAYRCTVS